jgi:hypothetical protein
MIELRREQVRFHVVHGDERPAECERQRLAVGQADEQRADQTGARGGGDDVDVVEAGAGFAQRARNDIVDGRQVLA